MGLWKLENRDLRDAFPQTTLLLLLLLLLVLQRQQTIPLHKLLEILNLHPLIIGRIPKAKLTQTGVYPACLIPIYLNHSEPLLLTPSTC